jgi:hypothetical protein
LIFIFLFHFLNQKKNDQLEEFSNWSLNRTTEVKWTKG